MRLLLPVLFLILVNGASAATLYCSPSGGGSGADFNNLATLPTTTGFTRGNTYVVVDGSYGSKTLSTATSGSTTIEIRKASAADSAVAGYASTLHDDQATFGTFTVVTQYWIVDGITRTESNAWTAPTGYGIRVTGQIRATSGDGHDADNSQFRYLDIGPAYNESPSDAEIATYQECAYIINDQQNVTFTRCAMHNSKGTIVQGTGSDGLVFEYCHFGPSWGKEAIRGGNGNPNDWIIRYCRFYDSTQTDPNDESSGITAEIGIWSWSGSVSGIQIYGNWFSNSKQGGRNSIIVVGGDGGGWAGDGADGTVVYNNTIAGIADDSAFADILLNGNSTIARNNLFYDITGVGVTADTVSDNDTAGADPFVNFATWDLRLSGATGAGFSLSSPYNLDPSGATRGSDDVWDVGAYEFQSTPPVTNTRGIPLNIRLRP